MYTHRGGQDSRWTCKSLGLPCCYCAPGRLSAQEVTCMPHQTIKDHFDRQRIEDVLGGAILHPRQVREGLESDWAGSARARGHRMIPSTR